MLYITTALSNRGFLMLAPTAAVFTGGSTFNGAASASATQPITCNYSLPAQVTYPSGNVVAGRTGTVTTYNTAANSSFTTFAIGHTNNDNKTSVVVRPALVHPPPHPSSTQINSQLRRCSSLCAPLPPPQASLQLPTALGPTTVQTYVVIFRNATSFQHSYYNLTVPITVVAGA